MPGKDRPDVIHSRAAGLDVHGTQVTATVRIARAAADPERLTKGFSTLSDWLRGHGVTAAAMEGTGVCREAVSDAGAEPPPLPGPACQTDQGPQDRCR